MPPFIVQTLESGSTAPDWSGDKLPGWIGPQETGQDALAPASVHRRAGTRPGLGIVDDDRPFLRALNRARGARTLIRYNCAAAVLKAAEAARAADSVPPWDAVLVTLGLPDLNGIAVIARLREWYPGLRIWAALGIEESHTLIGTICAGADGYLVKTWDARQERASLAALEQDRPPLGRSLAISLLQLAGDPLWNRRGYVPASLPQDLGLSRQQMQLLRLIARGDRPEIAGERMDLPAGGAHEILRGIYQQLRQPPLRHAVPQALRLHTLAELNLR